MPEASTGLVSAPALDKQRGAGQVYTPSPQEITGMRSEISRTPTNPQARQQQMAQRLDSGYNTPQDNQGMPLQQMGMGMRQNNMYQPRGNAYGKGGQQGQQTGFSNALGMGGQQLGGMQNMGMSNGLGGFGGLSNQGNQGSWAGAPQQPAFGGRMGNSYSPRQNQQSAMSNFGQGMRQPMGQSQPGMYTSPNNFGMGQMGQQRPSSYGSYGGGKGGR
jgi:hypothetical protein